MPIIPWPGPDSTDPRVAPALAIPGWMRPRELEWMISMAKDAHVLEIGCLRGRSTLAWFLGGAASVTSIDNLSQPWVYTPDEPHPAPSELEGKIQTNLGNYASHWRRILRDSTSSEAWQDAAFLSPPDGYDIAFIDGDHGYGTVCNDIKLCRHCLKPGGILCGHDFSDEWGGVQKAVMELVPDYNIMAGSIWATTIK